MPGLKRSVPTRPGRSGRVALGVAALVAGLGLAGCSDDDGQESPVGNDSTDVHELPDAPDWEQLYLDEVEILREEFELITGELPPNDVEFVRFIDVDDYGRVHAECVRGQGFEAEESWDGGVSYGRVPPEQSLASHTAIYRCHIAYPVHPRYFLPRTEEQVRVVYDYFVDELVPCLAELGYEVSPAPSWEAFLADEGSQGQWFPYLDVDPPSDQEEREVNEACPQNPPLEALFDQDS
jgi:hypothetical protein